MPVRTVIERGPKGKRAVAFSLDWPGWNRGAKTPEAALDALEAYRERYRAVAALAGLAGEFDAAGPLEVVEDKIGTGSTDFWGISFTPSSTEQGPMAEVDLERGIALLEAAWSAFDDVVAAAPATLRKGPRGGGRDRDAVAAHVLDTEPAYARKAGLGRPAPKDRVGLDALRADLLGLLVGSPGPAPDARGWPAPYVVRRMAWHALDHAWEIEDRAGPAADQPPATGAVRS